MIKSIVTLKNEPVHCAVCDVRDIIKEDSILVDSAYVCEYCANQIAYKRFRGLLCENKGWID